MSGAGTLRLTLDELAGWALAIDRSSTEEGDTTWHLSTAELKALVADAATARELHELVNTPELVDFANGVHLEAVHQEQRWGSADRKSKQPYEWFWLLSHLATRALEHHKEAERLLAAIGKAAESGELTDGSRRFAERTVAHHREKAAHHTITAAAVLAHWHAGVIGKHTAMEPGHSASKALAAELLGEC